jgi:hypothetical protein
VTFRSRRPSSNGMQALRGPGRATFAVVVGHVTHEHGPDGRIAAGGPALAAARTYRALGAATRLVTAVGHDFACDDELAVIPAELRRGGQTTELARDADRLLARAAPVLAVDLPEAWRRCDVLHLAPVAAEVDLARWAQVASARLVAIDVAGFARAPGVGGALVARRPWTDRRALISVDVACAHERELRAHPGLRDHLVAAVPIVSVVGAHGIDVLVRGRGVRVSERPPRDAAAFAAAFCVELARGMAPADAGALASAPAGARDSAVELRSSTGS